MWDIHGVYTESTGTTPQGFWNNTAGIVALSRNNTDGRLRGPWNNTTGTEETARGDSIFGRPGFRPPSGRVRDEPACSVAGLPAFLRPCEGRTGLSFLFLAAAP